MIPIRIKNVGNPNGGGTVIHPSLESGDRWLQKDTEPVSKSSPLELLNQLSITPEYHSYKKLPTAVTIKEHIIVLNVNSNRKSVSHGFLAGIFGTLDRFGIVVDLISTSEVHVSMAIEDGPAKKFVDRLVNDLRKSGTVRSTVIAISTSDLMSPIKAGLCPPRYGDTFAGRKTYAEYGRDCGSHVYDTCTREREY
jgi:aspartate kinase